jgi:RNA polymerase sigma-70 factor (ECF subfamily)
MPSRDDLKAKDLQRLADEDVMPLVEQKDPSAFEILFDRHGGAAYSLAYRIVGERATAEDVTQEAFLSMWRSRDRYDRSRGSVRTWLLGIVRNRAIDVLRRDVAQAPALTLHGEVPERPSVADHTDVQALRHESSRLLRRALSVLPSDQMRVIELAYFGGLTHSEISELLGMPLGTVKGRMRLGMEKMRTGLAEEL